jgi:oxygen-independent coproporphyrinogen-3 oxidase
VGFEQINIDLIAGMEGDTDDKWRDAVERALALSPDNVTLYQMEVPYNTTLARDAKRSGRAAPVATWAQKRAWVAHAFEVFEGAGYRGAYTLVKPSIDAEFVYRDALWHGADMVGLGVASFSQVAGVHFQNHDMWGGYIGPLVDRDELPIARAMVMTDRQRLIREFVLQLKLGGVRSSYFREKFGEDVLDVFADALLSLVDESLAVIEGDDIHLTREGLLCVDELLPRFFEPAYRNVRYT